VSSQPPEIRHEHCGIAIILCAVVGVRRRRSSSVLVGGARIARTSRRLASRAVCTRHALLLLDPDYTVCLR
jgi:hypothetical protein